MHAHAIMVLFALAAGPAWAQNWLHVEIRDIPAQCSRPLSCIDRSQLALRNVLYMTPTDRQLLLQTLNRIATIRGLPEDTRQQSVMASETMISVLHPLPTAERLATLVNHPGVLFDSERLDADPETATFGSYVREQLSQAGVRFLTEEEWDATPGRPTLSVRYAPRAESAGCIIPFSVSMSISEEAVMVRNPNLKITGTAWSKQTKENLANLNYTPFSALSEVVSAFVTDWTSQNPP